MGPMLALVGAMAFWVSVSQVDGQETQLCVMAEEFGDFGVCSECHVGGERSGTRGKQTRFRDIETAPAGDASCPTLEPPGRSQMIDCTCSDIPAFGVSADDLSSWLSESEGDAAEMFGPDSFVSGSNPLESRSAIEQQLRLARADAWLVEEDGDDDGVPAALRCADGLASWDEGDADCGGSVSWCAPCALGKSCRRHSDCAPGAFCGASNVCRSVFHRMSGARLNVSVELPAGAFTDTVGPFLSPRLFTPDVARMVESAVLHFTGVQEDGTVPPGPSSGSRALLTPGGHPGALSMASMLVDPRGNTWSWVGTGGDSSLATTRVSPKYHQKSTSFRGAPLAPSRDNVTVWASIDAVTPSRLGNSSTSGPRLTPSSSSPSQNLTLSISLHFLPNTATTNVHLRDQIEAIHDLWVASYDEEFGSEGRRRRLQSRRALRAKHRRLLGGALELSDGEWTDVVTSAEEVRDRLASVELDLGQFVGIVTGQGLGIVDAFRTRATVGDVWNVTQSEVEGVVEEASLDSLDDGAEGGSEDDDFVPQEDDDDGGGSGGGGGGGGGDKLDPNEGVPTVAEMWSEVEAWLGVGNNLLYTIIGGAVILALLLVCTLLQILVRTNDELAASCMRCSPFCAAVCCCVSVDNYASGGVHARPSHEEDESGGRKNSCQYVFDHYLCCCCTRCCLPPLPKPSNSATSSSSSSRGPSSSPKKKMHAVPSFNATDPHRRASGGYTRISGNDKVRARRTSITKASKVSRVTPVRHHTGSRSDGESRTSRASPSLPSPTTQLRAPEPVEKMKGPGTLRHDTGPAARDRKGRIIDKEEHHDERHLREAAALRENMARQQQWAARRRMEMQQGRVQPGAVHTERGVRTAWG